MRYVVLVLLILFGCQQAEVSNIEDSVFTCPDGLKVPDKSYCDDKPEASSSGPVEPIKKPVDDTDVDVGSKVSAKEAFQAYVNRNGLDYDFVSSEFYETKNGVDYYKVIYKYYELSGGKRELVIDSNGRVYEMYGVI